MTDEKPDLLGMTADVVAAFLSRNQIRPDELPALIRDVHGSLAGTVQPQPPQEPEIDRPTPAQIRKSIRPDALISFEDGKSYKTLKRHLTTRGLTFAQYQEKWGLPKDYPSVAPAYAARRSELAKAAGLGQKGRSAGSTEAGGKSKNAAGE
jgi:predicted transcriptional regulator